PRRRRPQGDDRVRLTRKNARGGRPPLPEPPLVGDVGGAFGASLRAWMQGRAIPGRRTQTPGRSPCFRTLRVSFHGKGRQTSPFVGAARWAARARHRLAPTRPGPVSFHPSWCRQAWGLTGNDSSLTGCARYRSAGGGEGDSVPCGPPGSAALRTVGAGGQREVRPRRHAGGRTAVPRGAR